MRLRAWALEVIQGEMVGVQRAEKLDPEQMLALPDAPVSKDPADTDLLLSICRNRLADLERGESAFPFSRASGIQAIVK